MYQVFLERENLGDGHYKPISLDEWLKVVRKDPDLDYSYPAHLASLKVAALPDKGCITIKFENGVVYAPAHPYVLQKLSDVAVVLQAKIYVDNSEISEFSA